jgi:flagellar hook-associated protein 1
MASLFQGLNTGYTGLSTSQVSINTIGHNIANAENENYTRQRVNQKTNVPLTEQNFQLGAGVGIDSITRIHDEFVYKRLNSSKQDKEFSHFNRKTLEEISTLFPEIDDVGIKNNFHKYMDAWASVAQDFNNIAQKSVLAQEAKNLTESIHDVRQRLVNHQSELNEQLEVNVKEINRMAKQIADLNIKITVAESVTDDNANDLRDQRDALETTITKMVNTTIVKFNLKSNNHVHRDLNDYTDTYNLSIGGFSIVDGKTFHEIKIMNNENANEMNTLYYERQDGYLFDMTDQIVSGKLGALLDLRGTKLDPSTNMPANGKIQSFIDQLDSFATSMIDSTNNIYAASATDVLESNKLPFDGDSVFAESDMDIRTGDFDIILYDVDGNEKGRRNIQIDAATTMTHGYKSIISQLNENTDDSGNFNELDDFDDKFIAHYIDGVLHVSARPAGKAEGYTIAIEDHGTNFAGALGLHKFFDGNDATNIGLHAPFADDPSLIKAYGRADEGNNEVANMMLQLQYDKIKFNNHGNEISETLSDYFDLLTTDVASLTNIAITKDETYTTQLSSIQREYDSISKVSVDEELTNLIKFQTAYTANAKIITTIDKMIDTLLGIKQ